MIVLSLFPGIGLLDRGFESAGYCVVRGPDLIWGGDIRQFNVPAGHFDGVFGGSPCQDFSTARRDPPTGNGVAMLREFGRVVLAADPAWWLLENVPRVPNLIIEGYTHQRLDVWAHEFGVNQRRSRHIQFGSRDDTVLILDRPNEGRRNSSIEAVMASDTTKTISDKAELQGLPRDFDIPAFKRGALSRAIGNGVPVPVAIALAVAVRDRVPVGSVKLCGCSCGRRVTAGQTYAGAACRMRMYRQRKRKSSRSYTTIRVTV